MIFRGFEESFQQHPKFDLKTIKMESGRLMAQAFHIGRKIQNTIDAYTDYEEITAIVLGVRNTKELTKISLEIANWYEDSFDCPDDFEFEEFWDHNPEFYGTNERVHTVTAFGPTTQEIMDPFVGHLTLYK